MSCERGERGSSCVVRSFGDVRLRLHSYSNDISWRRSGIVLVWLKSIPLLSESSGVKSICRYQRALCFRAWDICIYIRSRHHFSKILLAGNLANKYLVSSWWLSAFYVGKATGIFIEIHLVRDADSCDVECGFNNACQNNIPASDAEIYIAYNAHPGLIDVHLLSHNPSRIHGYMNDESSRREHAHF